MSRLLGIACFTFALLPGCGSPQHTDTTEKADAYPHLRLGNPSKATEETDDKDNFLMKKEWFALSFNNSKATPNWVSWRLAKEDVGDKRPEPGPFKPDDLLPKGFHHAKPADYRFATTGFERGHMCSNADRGHSLEAAATTFVMTNMVPQSHELNTGAWESLEKYCRTLARGKKEHELYIIAGPAGKGGSSSKGTFDTTDGTIVVPAKCWKVVLVLEAEEGDPIARVTAKTRVISVIMPNDTTPGKAHWADYRVSLKAVEDLTGYTFFEKVPEAIRKELREKIDDVTFHGGK
jgi:endonuclease G, mitochondrial